MFLNCFSQKKLETQANTAALLEHTPPRRCNCGLLARSVAPCSTATPHWRRPPIIPCDGCLGLLADQLQSRSQCLVTSSPSSRAFHDETLALVPLGVYLSTVMRKTASCSYCLVLTLVYIDRIKTRHPGFIISDTTLHRLFLGCILVSTKHWEDSYYSNSYLASASGVSIDQLNAMELQLLSLLGFRLYVSPSKYQFYLDSILVPLPGPQHLPLLTPMRTSFVSTRISTSTSHTHPSVLTHTSKSFTLGHQTGAQLHRPGEPSPSRESIQHTPFLNQLYVPVNSIHGMKSNSCKSLRSSTSNTLPNTTATSNNPQPTTHNALPQLTPLPPPPKKNTLTVPLPSLSHST